MRIFKYILVFFVLSAAAMVINGGTKVKCAVEADDAPTVIKRSVVQGIPDLVSFANYINQ